MNRIKNIFNPTYIWFTKKNVFNSKYKLDTSIIVEPNVSRKYNRKNMFFLSYKFLKLLSFSQIINYFIRKMFLIINHFKIII